MDIKTLPPLPFQTEHPSEGRIRLTIPVTPEVHATFKRLAAAGSMSTGRAMADWLADTIEAAEFMASTMERARAAPKLVVQEMHAYALGLQDETGALMRSLAEKGRADRAAAAQAAASGPTDSIPPACNTGGKLPKTSPAPRRVNSGFPLPPAKVQAYADTNGVPPKRRSVRRVK